MKSVCGTSGSEENVTGKKREREKKEKEQTSDGEEKLKVDSPQKNKRKFIKNDLTLFSFLERYFTDQKTDIVKIVLNSSGDNRISEIMKMLCEVKDLPVEKSLCLSFLTNYPEIDIKQVMDAAKSEEPLIEYTKLLKVRFREMMRPAIIKMKPAIIKNVGNLFAGISNEPIHKVVSEKFVYDYYQPDSDFFDQLLREHKPELFTEKKLQSLLPAKRYQFTSLENRIPQHPQIVKINEEMNIAKTTELEDKMEDLKEEFEAKKIERNEHMAIVDHLKAQEETIHEMIKIKKKGSNSTHELCRKLEMDRKIVKVSILREKKLVDSIKASMKKLKLKFKRHKIEKTDLLERGDLKKQ